MRVAAGNKTTIAHHLNLEIESKTRPNSLSRYKRAVKINLSNQHVFPIILLYL